MELLFVLLIGAAIGLIVRYSTPHRERSGVILLPAIGGASASLTWVVLTWVGLAWDGGWIWWASVLVPIAATVLTALRIGARRVQHDDARFAELAGVSATP